MPKFHIFIEIDQNGQQTIESRGDPSFWPLVGRLAACHHPQKTTLGPPESKSDIALATLGWSGFGDIQLWAEAVRECALRGEDYLAARAVSEATAAPIRERLQLPESTTPLEVFVALDAALTCKVSEAKGYQAQVEH